MLTLKKVNAELAKIDSSVELVSAPGYFYFWPKHEGNHWLDGCSTTSVMVNRINDLSLSSWLEELNILIRMHR